MSTSTAILESIIEPEEGGFSVEHARYVLSLSLPKSIQKHYLNLSEKAQRGVLSDTERAKLDEYLNANALLIILKSKARISLKKHGLAA